MKHDESEPSRAFMSAIAALIEAIVALKPTAWVRCHCELHYQYSEFVIWLETHSLEQTTRCAHYLSSIYQEYAGAIDGINLCTWIYLKHGNRYRVYSLYTSEDVLAAASGERPLDVMDFYEQSAKKPVLFK